MKKMICFVMVTAAMMLSSCDWFDSGGGGSSSDSGGGEVPQDDGLPDSYEVSGKTYYGMDLYGMGARADQVDLFIHVLTMDLSSETDDGMKLQKAALDKVVAAFLAEGVHVHFDVGPVNCLYDGDDLVSAAEHSIYDLGSGVSTHVVAEYDTSTKPAISLSRGTYMPYSTYEGDVSKFLFVDELRYNSAYFPANSTSIGGTDVNRNYAFHVLAFGGSQEDDGTGGSSGLAWVGGRDFLVALKGWELSFTPGDWDMTVTEDELKNYVANYQAATIMHEFGHNLGLLHGGDESTNYKPNYYSIMNYLYQMEGLPVIGNREGDRYYYDRFYGSGGATKWRNLLDTSYYLDDYYELEYAFKNGPFSNSLTMSYSHGYGGNLDEYDLNENKGLRQDDSGSVDFDGSLSISSSITEDINPSNDSSYSTLTDYDDWHNLKYYYATYAAGGRTVAEPDLEYVREDNKPRTRVDWED